MISIDRLRLTLPAGFEGRADAVARRVAEELASLPQTDSRRLTRLILPPMTLDPRLGDGEIARRIANAIHQQLAVADAGGDGGAAIGTDTGRERGGDGP
jgi:hypothetical protein